MKPTALSIDPEKLMEQIVDASPVAGTSKIRSRLGRVLSFGPIEVILRRIG